MLEFYNVYYELNKIFVECNVEFLSIWLEGYKFDFEKFYLKCRYVWNIIVYNFNKNN